MKSRAATTAAAPLFFPARLLDESGTRYQDGLDTPLPQASAEGRKIWPHKRRPDYILSFGRPGTRSQEPDHMTDPDMDAYNQALEALQLEEKSKAFDARLTAASSDIEKTAAEIVQKIRAYDWDNTYDKPLNVTGKRVQGEHFLGNVDLINKTELFKIAKKMPKGAHLHIHFNSCLPAKFNIHSKDTSINYTSKLDRLQDIIHGYDSSRGNSCQRFGRQ
ncbi:hypothetical protein IFR05_013704 [Cadophora sp. M221]|nr:hypothetical protein IFR05_013704 [Cadophora sp. M221]